MSCGHGLAPWQIACCGLGSRGMRPGRWHVTAGRLRLGRLKGPDDVGTQSGKIWCSIDRMKRDFFQLEKYESLEEFPKMNWKAI